LRLYKSRTSQIVETLSFGILRYLMPNSFGCMPMLISRSKNKDILFRP
jgi:hypothetical protein